MSDVLTDSFAGVTVPESPLIDRSIQLARQKYEPYLFNHAMRSWLFAVRFGQKRGIASGRSLQKSDVDRCPLSRTLNAPNRPQRERASEVCWPHPG